MTSLADKVARVKELQANCFPDGIKDAQAIGYAIFMFKQEADNMATLITQLWDENQKQREVLGMAREALNWAVKHDSYDHDIPRKALTAIDNVMKGEGV